mgnify:CR=1 FL=1
MNSSLLVSVLIPAYNAERYLTKCLDSVLEQDYKKLEIIIVDDGSIDETSEICDDYARRDSRIKVIHQENQGLAETRNVLVRNAKGEFVTFIDSDDTVNPQYVSTLLGIINKYDADIAICGMCYELEDGTIIPNPCPGFQNKKLSSVQALVAMNSWTSFSMSAWSKLYRRTLFSGIEYPPGRLSEDGFTTFKLLYVAKTIAYVDKPVYRYLRRANSITNSSALNFDHVHAADEQANFLYERWVEGRDVCLGYCLLARLYLYGLSATRHIKLSVDERDLLLKGNIRRMLALYKNKYVPIRKKIQSTVFACFPRFYYILYMLLKGSSSK